MRQRGLKALLTAVAGVSLWAASAALGLAQAQVADAALRLAPGTSFTIQFPEMPPTFFALETGKSVPAQMTVFLPTNYDPAKPFPLLIFLNGWDGGAGGNPGVARGLCEDRDFVCLSVPLFKSPDFRAEEPNKMGPGFVITEPDGRTMWPLFKTMLAKLEELVPNIDPAHRVLGGFSNGAHATAALIDGSDGEVTEQFSAFLFGEGGGKLVHYERLKDKPFLMLSSNSKSLPRATEIAEAAKAAGAQTTLIFEDIGKHGLPESAYPKIREWLRGPALGLARPEPNGGVE